MDPLTAIREVAPADPALESLIKRHLELMYASSPACSVHAMDAQAMSEAGVRFFAAFEGDAAVAMGALKTLTGGDGELKSMHVLAERRGSGLAQQILNHLVEAARTSGMQRISLETGSQDVFAPARAFYARAGFTYCEPFEGYELDPHSVFMTCEL